MDIETIKKQIQAETDSYNRDRNRLQQELSNLKQRHQRNMEYLKRQKVDCEQRAKSVSACESKTSRTETRLMRATKTTKQHECRENQYKSSENDFIHINRDLKKFL